MAMQEAQEVVQVIRDLADELGRTPTFDEVVRAGVPRTAVVRHFGTYNRAVEAAGLVPNRVPRPYRRWTREKMIVAVRELHALIGCAPNTADMRAFPEVCPSPRLILREFGSMKAFLREAGIEAGGSAACPRRRSSMCVPGMAAVREWLAGREACGYRPEPAEIAEVAGPEGYRLLLGVASGAGFARLAREHGMTEGAARAVLASAIKRLAALVPEEQRAAFFRVKV
ncbi:MAG: hypothetical protein H5U04_07480 [Firmicutes bacterium]|nr:hypothetical protein [Bacillota bacterium]